MHAFTSFLSGIYGVIIFMFIPDNEVFINAYNKGLIDKTVKEINDINSFYLTTTHALMGLCKKLANSNILIQDEKMDKVKEIEMLIDIFMVNIKA